MPALENRTNEVKAVDAFLGGLRQGDLGQGERYQDNQPQGRQADPLQGDHHPAAPHQGNLHQGDRRQDERRQDDQPQGNLQSAPQTVKRSQGAPLQGGRVQPEHVPALVDLLRNRSYEEVRQRMYESAPGSPWWTACRAELDLRNGQQVADASLAMSRVAEKMRGSTQHFEQLADTLCQATNDVADLLRNTQQAGRRLEIAIYVVIGVSLVQFFNLVFEIFRRR